MKTKSQLIALHNQIENARDEIKVTRKNAESTKRSITDAAIAKKYDQLPALVADYETAITEYEMAQKRQKNLLAKRNEWGYSSTDLYYYATGARAEYFGGGLVAIKPAN